MVPHIVFGTTLGNHRYDLLSVVMIGLLMSRNRCKIDDVRLMGNQKEDRIWTLNTYCCYRISETL